MNCDRARELLSPHLDQVVVDPERSDLRQHLEGCQDCREHFESLDQVVSLIRGIPPVRAPGGFRDAVQNGLPPRIATKSRLIRLIPQVAAAVLLVSFGYLGALTFLQDSGGPPPAGGLIGSAGEKAAAPDAVISGDRFENGLAQSAPVAEPPAPSGAVDAPVGPGIESGAIGIGGGGGGAFENRPLGETALVAGARSSVRAERSLEYVVSGGKPDATAGLILAELQNRRSRATRAETRSAVYDSGGPRELEEVFSDEEGEPARLVLYLTADEVQYILTLLARRNGAATRVNLLPEEEVAGDGPLPPAAPAAPAKPEAKERTRDDDGADDAEEPAPVADPASGKTRPGAKAKERSSPEVDKATPSPHRFRVELRFDRER